MCLPVAAAEAPLAPRHERWLEAVAPLLTDEEREYFLGLDRDYRRDAFIEKFWQVRDPEKRTYTNELRRRWLERVDQAKQQFGDLGDERALLYLLNGEPGRVVWADGREMSICYHRSDELEVWFYGGSDQTTRSFAVILRRREAGAKLRYEVWLPGDRLAARGRSTLPTTNVAELCAEEVLPGVVRRIQEDLAYPAFIESIMSPPTPPAEWVATFESFSAAAPPGAASFPVDLHFEFPGRNQSRTVVQGMVLVPSETAGTLEFDGQHMHNFLLTGEVVREQKLFETFRYRFELLQGEATEDVIPLVFQRKLRPGPVRIIIKVEDLFARRVAVVEKAVEIPLTVNGGRLAETTEDVAWLRPWAEASAAALRGETTIQIVPLQDGDVHIGMVCFDTVTSGEFSKVTFFLNDRPIMTKRRPPYSVELDLGRVAASHRLRVSAFDEEGSEVASDELAVNQGGQRFRVHLTEPRSDKAYRESLSAVAQVQAPDGAEVERVEIYLDERRIATLYQPPYQQALLLENDGLAYVRAVAYLKDGNSTEDVVFINAPDYLEEVEIRYVELFASVVDAKGRPVLDLEEDDFAVVEDGSPQNVRRFEWVKDLPIHAGLLLDTSASMEESLAKVSEAALSFVEQTITGKDRVALLSFNHRPRVQVRFTAEVQEIARSLAGLKAEGSTALYDSLVYALHYFHGMNGQRVLILLSDGKDEASHFDFESALEVARRSGVTVYIIGLKEAAKDKEARRVLRRIASETGGRSFFVDDPAELAQIYASIQEELRSQYLLAYQSTSDKDPSQFRRIEVHLVDQEGEVRTMSGYYP